MSGLPPRIASGARVLILGSFPGKASLAARQYYAHPRNQFWPIIGSVLGFDPALPYEQRIAALLDRRIGLWDVLASCNRIGSLDSQIERHSEIANAIDGLLGEYPSIAGILLNGSRAATCFRRHLASTIDRPSWQLPSTSPANARLDLVRKRAIWHAKLGDILGPMMLSANMLDEAGK